MLYACSVIWFKPNGMVWYGWVWYWRCLNVCDSHAVLSIPLYLDRVYCRSPSVRIIWDGECLRLSPFHFIWTIKINVNSSIHNVDHLFYLGAVTKSFEEFFFFSSSFRCYVLSRQRDRKKIEQIFQFCNTQKHAESSRKMLTVKDWERLLSEKKNFKSSTYHASLWYASVHITATVNSCMIY